MCTNVYSNKHLHRFIDKVIIEQHDGFMITVVVGFSVHPEPPLQSREMHRLFCFLEAG